MSSCCRERNKGKIKQDKFGRYHIRFKDSHPQKKVYNFEAPNNVFFNEEINLSTVAAA
jgi:hypothetical protein